MEHTVEDIGALPRRKLMFLRLIFGSKFSFWPEEVSHDGDNFGILTKEELFSVASLGGCCFCCSESRLS